MKTGSFFKLGLVALVLVGGMTGELRADTFGTGANTFEIDFTTIGNPGNTADTTGSPNPAGSVGYVYRMGTYEVSRDMITKANSAGNLGITLVDMSDFGGNGVDKPATGISWNEAARFVNYLNVSSGFSAAYKFSLQPGDAGYSANSNLELWEVGDVGYNAANPYRNSNARYVLPSVDEWYKAAYYDPNSASYFNYPTGSDTVPTAVTGGTSVGTAVYGQSIDTGPSTITNAGGLSPYGTMGQGGNVWEWEESAFSGSPSAGSSRGLRGGAWLDDEDFLRASIRSSTTPADEGDGVGFRVASVPEPSAALLILVGIGALLAIRRWKVTH